ncbi:hypothetical protein AAC387_Pa02g2583 [Persea americana]
MRILEAYHSAEEEKITLRQLVLTRQGPGESVVSYIDEWLEITYRCEDHPPRNMWIRLCLHSLHHDFRILASVEDFRKFEELAMFMETVEGRALFPLRSMTRRTRATNMMSLIQDSDYESHSEKVSSVFTNPPPTAGYEPPFYLYSDLYPIFKVKGSTFLVPAKKHWKHDMIFHRAEDASTPSPLGNFINEGKPNFKLQTLHSSISQHDKEHVLQSQEAYWVRDD